MVAEAIRREALVWGQIAANKTAPKDYADHARRVSVQLRRIAGVVDIHGLAGLHGYMACYDYNTGVDKSWKFSVQTAVKRILAGEVH